ncbi:ATPase AAA-type core [Penicillium malachiteum]|nr:ATPase AAA-type core [Penicillium malachiteum]
MDGPTLLDGRPVEPEVGLPGENDEMIHDEVTNPQESKQKERVALGYASFFKDNEDPAPVIMSEENPDEIEGVAPAEPGDSNYVTEVNSETVNEEEREAKSSSRECIARKGKVDATVSKEVKDHPHIVFVDPIGTRWLFPYEVAKTWDGVKMLLKSVFVDIYLPEWIAEDIDATDEGHDPDFFIIQTKPDDCRILASHWDRLVSPGWEFKIQFTVFRDVCGAISREKNDQMRRSNAQDEVDATNPESVSEKSDSEGSVKEADEKPAPPAEPRVRTRSNSDSDRGSITARPPIIIQNTRPERYGGRRYNVENSSDSEYEEPDPKVEMSSIVYVANYLTQDNEGDYFKSHSARSADKTQLNESSEFKSINTVLEEHREVYSNDRNPTRRGRGNPVYDTISDPVLYINSPFLLNALKAVIECQSPPDEFTPRQLGQTEYRGGRSTTLTRGSGYVETDLARGQFAYPFTDIYHHREKLAQYREKIVENHDDEYTATCKEHIDIMLGYIYDLVEIGLRDVELLFSSSTPKTTFSSLWLLFKPGSDVYVREYGTYNTYVIESVTGGFFSRKSGSRSSSYCVTVWYMNYYGGKYLTRSTRRIYIPAFEYEREITSLPLYPVQYHVDENPENPLRQQLIERGKRFVEMGKKPTYMEYTGPSKMEPARTFTQTRVIVDHSPLREPDEDEDDELGKRTRKPTCPCATCKANGPTQHDVERRLFDNYDSIDLQGQEVITDHQYLLCRSHVYAYVLKDRAWDSLLVTGMREPKIDKNIIDTLVMKPESNKSLIKAVCEIFGGAYTQAFSSDFVRGKGEGQILLLHGPPGTGKTLTAESVAEYTGRPLLSIAAAELGHEPERLEDNLLQFFRDAKKWNAIVLLDEADVYLETRSSNDLRRNSIVSVFLRALDYFQGILFLTTNRVGSFDEAFMSRIHVQIGYDPLDEDSRQKIWDGYFQKLDSNHEDGGQKIEYSMSAKEYVEVKEDLRILEWNGREIRNGKQHSVSITEIVSETNIPQAFQTAVALACFEAKSKNRTPKLTDKHLAQVVTMSHNFKSYLRSVQGADGDLAWAARVRNDKVKASEGKISNTHSTRI